MTPQPFVSRKDLPWFGLFTALFAASIGVASGEANHLVYLLPGFHAADPSFLSADWFVTGVEHPHAIFNAIVGFLARSGLTELGLAAGTLLQSLVLATALWALARRLYDRPLLPWAMSLMILGAIGTRGVGLTMLTAPQFEASAVAGVATVSALALLAGERTQPLAGLAFGVAALFHAHFAVLLAPVAAVAAVAVGWRRGPLAGLAVLLPVLALGAPSYLQVLQHGADPAFERSQELILRRFPHHNDPRTWGPLQGLLFAGIIAVGTAGVILRRPKPCPALAWTVAFLAAVAFGSLLVGYAGLSETVMLLFPWRLASIVIALAVLAATAATAHPPLPTPRLRQSLLGGLVLVALATAAVTVLGPVPTRVGLAVTAALIVTLWIAWTSDSQQADLKSGTTRPGLLAVLLLGFVPGVWHGLERSHVEVHPGPSERTGLYTWIAHNTPADAVFAVPPGWIDFRLATQRAVVADHKSPPNDPTELLEWVERIEASTGLVPAGEAAQLDTAFLAASCERLQDVGQEYEADFVIRPAGAPPCGHVVHSDAEFAVIELPSD